MSNGWWAQTFGEYDPDSPETVMARLRLYERHVGELTERLEIEQRMRAFSDQRIIRLERATRAALVAMAAVGCGVYAAVQGGGVEAWMMAAFAFLLLWFFIRDIGKV